MKSILNLKDLITPAEAADLRGVSRSSISELIQRGRLGVVEIAGKRFLSRREVENFERRPAGRPRKIVVPAPHAARQKPNK